MIPRLLRGESDADLVRKALRNHPDAFEGLILRYQRKACAIALGIGVRPDSVQDVLQEAFLQGFRDLPDLRKPDSFRPWFLTIVRNVARRHLGPTGPPSLTSSLETRAGGYADGFERTDFAAYLWKKVQGLPEGVREAILLYYYEGESVKSVASTLGVTRDAVINRLRRGRDLLREKLWREMEECIRDMLPSTREWKRGARRLALIVLAGVPTVASGASPGEAAAADLAGVAPSTGILGGGLLMGVKKAILGIIVAALLAIVGLSALRFEEGASRGVDAGPDSSAAPLKAAMLTGDSPPGKSGAGSDVAVESKRAPRLPESPGPVDFSLVDRDLDLFGIVVDEGDRPIAGATLEARWNPEGDVYAGPDHVRPPPVIGPSTRSATDGTFVLRLAADQVVDLHAVAPGFARVVSPMVNAGEMVKIVLPPSSAIRLEIKDRDGEAVADATARLYLLCRGSMSGRRGDEREGRTDEEGRHLFDQLEAGEGYLDVRHEVHGFGYQRFRLAPGERMDVRIRLMGGRRVTGQVRDLETGAPIPGASVGPGYGFGPAVKTDVEGRYEFGAVGKDSFSELRARAEGYVPRQLSVPAEGELDFELHRGHVVSGRLLDDRGLPVSDARVYLSGTRSIQGALQSDGDATRTDPGGEFILSGLHPSVFHVLEIRKDGHPRLVLPVDHSKAVQGRIDLGDLILGPPVRIEGRALDSRGSPLARETVYAKRIPSGEELAPTPADHRVQGLVVIQRWTDDLGRFRFPDLCPGEYVLTLFPHGGERTTLPVTLRPGEDLLDVVLQANEGRSITVRVEREGGEPVSGAFVTVQGEGLRSRYPTQTDAAGRAVLTGLPDREVGIGVKMQGPTRLILPPALRVMPRGQEVVIRLQEGVLVKGVVVDEENRPVPGLTLRAAYTGNPRDSVIARTNHAGEFSLRCRCGETLDLRAYGSNLDEIEGARVGEEPAFFQGELRGVPSPAEGLEVRVRRLPMDRTVNLLVTNIDGEGVPGAFVEVSGPGLGPPGSPHRTDETGSLALRGLPPSQVRIRVFDAAGRGREDGDEPDAVRRVVPEGQDIVIVLGEGE